VVCHYRVTDAQENPLASMGGSLHGGRRGATRLVKGLILAEGQPQGARNQGSVKATGSGRVRGKI